MAHFKTSHFEILTAVTQRISMHLNNELAANSLPLIVANETMDIVVNELCKEFERDNPLFNETLFRAQCGEWIQKQRLETNPAWIANHG